MVDLTECYPTADGVSIGFCARIPFWPRQLSDEVLWGAGCSGTLSFYAIHTDTHQTMKMVENLYLGLVQVRTRVALCSIWQ